jgi:hypothetical protein
MQRLLLQAVLSIGIVIGSVSISAAQASPWTSAGSAGMVDEVDVAVYETSGALVRIAASAPVPASLVIRYNVVAVPGLSLGDVGAELTARFRDNGTGARVVATLKEVSFETGATTTLLTVDSNDATPSIDLESRTVSSCLFELDFGSNAYFIEAVLSKSAGAVTPALQLLRVSNPVC